MIGASAFLVAALVWRRKAATLLLLPILAAIIAAAAGRAPIGVRTDAYLVPLVALVMGLGFDAMLRCKLHSTHVRLQSYCKHVAIALSISVLAIGLPKRLLPEPYPLQDVRSLAKLWETQQDASDRLVLYCPADDPFALYSHRTFRVRPTGNAFDTIFDDPQIIQLDCALRDAPEKYGEEIQRALGNRPERMWLLVTHTWKGDVPLLKRAVAALGFSEHKVWATNGDAELTLYLRNNSE
jgi:hypothetical protein